MTEEIDKKSRPASSLEQFIIERCVRNMRLGYLEIFIFFSILNLAIWYLTFLFFGDNIFAALLMLILATVISLFSFSIWLSYKEFKIKKNYQIFSGQGEMGVEIEGSGKTRQQFLKVNGKKITLIPGMATIPKHGEKQYIEYEYVSILDDPPPFGYDNIFVSIDQKGFTKKHKTYIEQLKPFGLLSLIASIVFCFFIVFSIAIEFDDPSINYLCLALFPVFIRTMIRWRRNYKLKRTLLK